MTYDASPGTDGKRLPHLPHELRLVLGTASDDAFILDGIVAGDDVHCGQPVVLVLGRPDPRWFDLAVEDLLNEWTETSLVVDLQVKVGARGPVATLRNGSTATTVSLDLLAVA